MIVLSTLYASLLTRMTKMTKVANNLQNRQRYGDQSHTQRSLGSFIPELSNFKVLLFGILIGIFATSLVVFMFSTTAITLKIPTNITKTSVKNTENSNSEPVATPVQLEPVAAIQEPRFDFYTELTKNTPDSNTNTAASPPNMNNNDLKSTPKPINGYVVQVGSFKKNTDADSLKAKLTLNGFNAKIEPMRLLDGEIRHKGILGPFKTEKHAQLLQQKLKALEIDSIRTAV